MLNSHDDTESSALKILYKNGRYLLKISHYIKSESAFFEEERRGIRARLVARDLEDRANRLLNEIEDYKMLKFPERLHK